VDLVYNPDVTTFMTRALENGAEVMNGRDMLRLQAEKSWDIWLKNGL
jgi:shikimate dehydrogenase